MLASPDLAVNNRHWNGFLTRGLSPHDTRVSDMTHDNPICPNCSRPMKVARTIPPQGQEEETNVYECKICKLSFVTEDHCSIAGVCPH